MMAMFSTDLLTQLDGARMVVTAECESCGAFGISYWNGSATVNEAYWGECTGNDVWTCYELEQMSDWEVEQALREQLTEDMCPCSTRVLEVV